MKHAKKKRSRPSKTKQVKKENKVESNGIDEETRVLNCLMEAFSSVSIEEASLAYKQANGDANKAAEILGGLDDRAVSCSSEMSGSCFSSEVSGSTSSSEIFGSSSGSEMCVENKSGLVVGVVKAKPKKKVVAATGMVSAVLGKEYLSSGTKKGKSVCDVSTSKEDLEQFLCSMLGDDCELSMGVVRDVLCQCKYDVEKALSVLLELSASSTQHSASGRCAEDFFNITEDTRSVLESSNYFLDRTSDSTSHSSESELQDNVWPMGYNSRNYFSALVGSEAPASVSAEISESELSWKVLESLFNTPKSSEQKPETMNWRNVVKKMEALGKSAQSTSVGDKERTHAKGDEYRVCRESARQHWDLMKSYYQKAATAYSNGERDYAAYMSEKGRTHNKIAREADVKASQDIFQARNKSIENVITIDLHGQHVKPAMKLLKLHLLFGAYVRSVRWFRVITGCGTHGMGKSKLKQSVTNLLQKEGIQWSEENRGTLLIRLDGQTEFGFLDTDSDTE
ncbi:Smr domain-containing protein [Heracleum sosnowskyi]|uniref:Smr domain-containing protein n=1 Tax=Heracleum sosnowskyi TaxID=360622 RepID=A0AAD8J0V8_9APIA|nr:Smr domain-containing protein [Heracleum sosnowskyi]